MARRLCGPATRSSAVPPAVVTGRPPSLLFQLKLPVGMPNPDIDNSIDVDRSGRSDAFPFSSAGQSRTGKATVGPSQPMRSCQLKSKCIPSASAGGIDTRKYRPVANAKGFIRSPPKELLLLFL